MQTSAPASIDAQLAAARALFQRDAPLEAAALLRTLHTRDPAREDVAMLLAEVLRSQGRLGEASETLFALARANDFEPQLSLRCGGFARQCDRHAVAARICEAALEHAPVPSGLLVLAGDVAREAGDFATARMRYLAALDAGVDLEHQFVLGALANARRYVDPADPEIARFAKHFANARYSARSRASAGFALAKAKDDLADYPAAALVLGEANAMVHAARPWNAADWRSFVDARKRETVASSARPSDPGFVPVFIVGVPRTGTTLTAALLARASGARDRGELRALRYIAEQLIAGGHLGDPAALAEAANLYRTLASQDDAPATWYLDQDPMNFRYLHIAVAMFPQARVILLRRDRRDTALSLWSQDFAHPDLGFAYDFADMAAFMAGQDALLQHWRQALPVSIFELDYETLVAGPDAAVTKLCDFIGATASASGAVDETAPVQSASVWQARQPVYQTSVGRWRHYAPHVPELRNFG